MENLSSCDSYVLSEVPYSDTYPNDMINQDVQEMSYYEQTHIDTNSSAPNDLLVLSLVEQMTDHVANLDKENQINKMVNESLTAELERYKERVKEKESLSTTLTVFKTECKEKESNYMDKEIVLENQNKELENTLCKLYRSTQAMHMLTKPQVFYDNTHKQALGYQNPFHLKKAQRIKPTLYDGIVIAKEHDGVGGWGGPDTSVKSHTPVRIEAPGELPKVSLVNKSLKKLKYQLASFDKVVKKRTRSDAITVGKDIKVKKSKNEQKPTRNEETSDQEKT
ncbi:hypothetical protein Tco_1008758 [Tanacetum coccineum]